MRSSIWNGAQAAVRLAKGAVLRQAMFDVADPAVWIALDEAVRHSARSSADGTWLSAWQRTEQGRTPTDAQLALALCHRDGRVRERALGEVAGRPELLPLVVIRCADWAEPVRDRARTRWAEAVTVQTATALAPLALRIGVRYRGDFAVGLIDKVLRSADREALLPLLTHADRTVRRFAHRLAVEEGFLSPSSWPAAPPGTRTRSSRACARRPPWPPWRRATPTTTYSNHCSPPAIRGRGRPG